ncbi:TPA: hypothetical protein L4G11_001228 [Pseudomonas aeruginosa]|nr:hypothetical protein [Pseudomonas aeruginosa]
MSIDEWHAVIADKSGLTTEVVANTLESLHIRPKPILPRARTLNLLSIRMTGIKREKDQEVPFEFEWNDLSDGLWALLSEGNFKGKSSTLAAFRAAVQGKFPGKIKRDVWSWIATLRVRFKVDDVPYEISLRKQAGETNESKGESSLSRFIEGHEFSLYAGPAGEGLQSAVEDVFMDELGFDRFHAYRSAKGSVVEHGWSALSSALFITGNSPAVFGDHTEDGLPLRLIQMYIGLPWVSTYTAVSTALKRAKSEHERALGGATAERVKVSDRVLVLQEEKNRREAELSGLPDRSQLRTKIVDLDRQLAAEQAAITKYRNERDRAQVLTQDTSIVYAEARRLYQQAKDDAAAGYVFRKLQPACCPACESQFQPERFSEKVAEACGLCGNEALVQDGSESPDISHLEIAVQDSDAARKAAAEALSAAETQLSDAEKARTETLAKLDSSSEALSSTVDSEQILRDIAGIEGRMAELNALLAGPDLVASPEDESLRILTATETITKEAMEALQAEVMKEVEEHLFILAERFGVRNLESLSFKAHRMDIRQGGVDLTFGSLNAGENLRIRIAAALATLKVARSRGFGRHPGLLVLDSPAASEMSAADFSALIGAVSSTVAEIPGVQVIVGAVMRPELRSVVPSERRRAAEGADKLF